MTERVSIRSGENRMRNWLKEICFKNLTHKQAFYTFLEEMYLSEEEMNRPSTILKRQLGFVYLLALNQEAYKQYEGDIFYIEVGEELSLGGPTYLLEEGIGTRQYAHEQMLLLASSILKGDEIEESACPIEDKAYLEQALRIAGISK